MKSKKYNKNYYLYYFIKYRKLIIYDKDRISLSQIAVDNKFTVPTLNGVSVLYQNYGNKFSDVVTLVRSIKCMTPQSIWENEGIEYLTYKIEGLLAELDIEKAYIDIPLIEENH